MNRVGEAVQEAVEARAERLAGAPSRRLGWTEQDLMRRLKGGLGKIELARELRSKTTLPLAWIAQRLNMGTRGHLPVLLQRKPARSEEASDQGLLNI